MKWHVWTALILGVGTLTGALPLPALAQQQFNLGAYQLQQGTVIPVGTISTNGPQYFSSDTVHNVTLAVTQSIYDPTGRLVIPAGSQIYGQLQPIAGGARFVVNSISLNGRSYPIQASSGVIHNEKDPREYSSEAIAGDAAIGAVAGTVLGVITGGVTTTGVLGGAAAGVLTGNVTAPMVVVLRPGQSLNITLEAPVRF
jgi:hypothetical protein